MELRFILRALRNGDFLRPVQVAERQIVESGVGEELRGHAIDTSDGDVAFRLGGCGAGYESMGHEHGVQFGVCHTSGGQVRGDELQCGTHNPFM